VIVATTSPSFNASESREAVVRRLSHPVLWAVERALQELTRSLFRAKCRRRLRIAAWAHGVTFVALNSGWPDAIRFALGKRSGGGS